MSENMTVENYEYVQHKIKQRPWGYECSFSVVAADGRRIDDVIAVDSDTVSDEELSVMIRQRCDILCAGFETETEQITIINEDGKETVYEI